MVLYKLRRELVWCCGFLVDCCGWGGLLDVGEGFVFVFEGGE